jgi:hypothetical protein
MKNQFDFLKMGPPRKFFKVQISMRCLCKTADGTRCKREAVKKYCWQHSNCKAPAKKVGFAFRGSQKPKNRESREKIHKKKPRGLRHCISMYDIDPETVSYSAIDRKKPGRTCRTKLEQYVTRRKHPHIVDIPKRTRGRLRRCDRQLTALGYPTNSYDLDKAVTDNEHRKLVSRCLKFYKSVGE